MDKIKSYIALHREMLMYLVFGGLTTAVNYAVYFPLYNLLSVSATASNVIAWVFAVAFAFVTNKIYVFNSRDWTIKNILVELSGFLGCRIGSGALETGVIFVATNYLDLNGNMIKIFTGISVVILNYFGSKLFIFNKDKKGG